MLYFPKIITKLLLIILCAIITFHISFLSSKSISVQDPRLTISGISEIQYESYLNSLDRLKDKADFIKNTRTAYFFGLPSKTVYTFYWSYFAIIAILIFLVKAKLNESENEKQ